MPSQKVLEQKQQVVSALAERIQSSVAGVIVDYKGINVEDDTKLRKELRESGVKYTVIKNTLIKRAAEKAGLNGIDDVLNGTSAIATSAEDYVAAARILQKFAEQHDNFKVKTGYLDNEVISLDDNPLFGLNSPSSTRVALVSDFWTGPKTVAKSSTDDAELETDDSTKATKDESDDIEDIESEITLESRMKEACSECSAIYVPYESMLTDQMDVIGSIAEDEDVVVVAGDTNIGQHSLVTLFMDPYSLGYAAGKKAVRVFNGDDISTIKIGYGDTDECIKLYNGQIAEAFDIEFPKSFNEFEEFLSTYTYGSNTTRFSFN